jgi:sulfur carrier protein
MRIRVNGEERELPDGLTVLQVLERLGLGAARVAVAVNRDVVPRSRHGERVLAEGDRIEIVHAVQGG